MLYYAVAVFKIRSSNSQCRKRAKQVCVATGAAIKIDRKGLLLLKLLESYYIDSDGLWVAG